MLLDRLRVASPCTAEWDAMPGDARVRMCGDCKKHVYNLSELTHDEAEALIVLHEGNVCVRLFLRADGTILTADCAHGTRPRSLARRAALAGAAAALAAGCAVDGSESAEQDTNAIAPSEIDPRFDIFGDAPALDGELPRFTFATSLMGGASLKFDIDAGMIELARPSAVPTGSDEPIEPEPAGSAEAANDAPAEPTAPTALVDPVAPTALVEPAASVEGVESVE